MDPPGLEACNVRLTTVNDQGIVQSSIKSDYGDVLLYRMGLYSYHKLNFDDGSYKVNSDQWYDIDFLIDWDSEKQSVRMFVDGESSGKEEFFSAEVLGSRSLLLKRINSANAIMLYGLSPGGVSRFKNL